MGFSGIGKALIIAGLVIFVAGVLVLYGPKIPFLGKLPGDIRIQGQNGGFYFPVVTCIVISVIATIVLNLFFRK